MVARQVQRICPHRVPRGSRDSGGTGLLTAQDEGMRWWECLLGQASRAVGWGELSRWESFSNDRAIAKVGDSCDRRLREGL